MIRKLVSRLRVHLNSYFQIFIVGMFIVAIISGSILVFSFGLTVLQTIVSLLLFLSLTSLIFFLYFQSTKSQIETKKLVESIHHNQQQDLNNFYTDLIDLQTNTKAVIEAVLNEKRSSQD